MLDRCIRIGRPGTGNHSNIGVESAAEWIPVAVRFFRANRHERDAPEDSR